VLHIKNITFAYPKSDFSLCIDELQVSKGEKIAVIGPSGSGKTTLLNLIAGIIIPVKGSIQLNGTKIEKLDDTGRRALRISSIGFVFQDFKLIGYLSILENLLLPFRINPALTLDRAKQAEATSLALTFGISKNLKKYPSQLSHGERQRVAICRALITKPSLILADEPTGNLDPKNKLLILDILLQYVNQQNATLVTVTHDYELINRFDRVVDFQQFILSNER